MTHKKSNINILLNNQTNDTINNYLSTIFSKIEEIPFVLKNKNRIFVTSLLRLADNLNSFSKDSAAGVGNQRTVT